MSSDPEDVVPAEAAEDLCPDCGGSGRVEGEQCPTCGGTGTVTEPVGGG